MPSEKTLAVVLLTTPFSPEIFPIISLLITASTFHFFSKAYSARMAPPYKPCSSPDRPTKATDALNLCLVSTLAASKTPASPDALSFAPGESDSESIGSLTLESISPLIIINRFGSSDPRRMATILTTSVGFGILGPETMSPTVKISRHCPQFSEISSNSFASQRLAAPIPLEFD